MEVGLPGVTWAAGDLLALGLAADVYCLAAVVGLVSCCAGFLGIKAIGLAVVEFARGDSGFPGDEFYP